jgi:HEPN domain-containing protein
VDRHEKPTTVAYQDTFISHYFEYERRTYRWVQFSASQAIEMQEKGMIMKKLGSVL